ncbi:MAG: hypothetical protein NTW59_01960 [Candidatus Diapherotrites archaeon]|nr:hypothetical protein [Candidatus Diapherotrites archaeon]
MVGVATKGIEGEKKKTSYNSEKEARADLKELPVSICSMPTPKRRRFLIRQNQKRRHKRLLPQRKSQSKLGEVIVIRSTPLETYFARFERGTMDRKERESNSLRKQAISGLSQPKIHVLLELERRMDESHRAISGNGYYPYPSGSAINARARAFDDMLQGIMVKYEELIMNGIANVKKAK